MRFAGLLGVVAVAVLAAAIFDWMVPFKGHAGLLGVVAVAVLAAAIFVWMAPFKGDAGLLSIVAVAVLAAAIFVWMAPFKGDAEAAKSPTWLSPSANVNLGACEFVGTVTLNTKGRPVDSVLFRLTSTDGFEDLEVVGPALVRGDVVRSRTLFGTPGLSHRLVFSARDKKGGTLRTESIDFGMCDA